MRALKCVAMANGVFEQRERDLMLAVQKIFATPVDIDALEPITPGQLATAITDPQLRKQLVCGMLVMAMIDGEASPAETDLCEAYRAALDVDAYEVATVRKLSHGHFMLARFDVLRRFWAGERYLDDAKKRGLLWVLKGLAASFKIAENPELTARYRATGAYPEGTLGRAYYDSMVDNGFPFPGEKGCGPETIILHDLTHVISGYGTDPSSEICVSAFHAGYRRQEPFTFILFTMIQFQLGIKIAPLAEPTKLKFEPERVLEALRRGSLMCADLTDGTWDYWADMRLPLAEVRAKYGVVPEQL